MTEEIIIDITKCDFNTFDGGGSQRTICTLDNCFCDGIRNKDCYFKELKRLEFELKITKADYEASEQENKELREMLSKEPKAMQAFQIAYSGNKKENETLWEMVKDYKSALEEIREMCNKHLDAKEICYATQVIDKIDEVLND